MVTLAVKGCNGKDELDPFDSEITTLQVHLTDNSSIILIIAAS